MPDDSTSLIRDKKKIQQIKDFSGLQFGKIYPTDIDGFLDFGDKMFVFFELKYGNSPLSFGQKLALTRLCDACEADERKSCLIIANHQTPSGDVIDVANALVSMVMYKKKWTNWVGMNVTLRECIDRFRQKEAN